MRQTTRLGGKRVTIHTSKTGKVTVKPAPVLEWVMQAAQVRALRALPEYGREFLLVGGMEAGKRGRQEQVKAKATGLTAGHPDLTIFLRGARVAMIENKAATGRLSMEQKDRHTALRSLGHVVEVVRSESEADAAEKAVKLVKGWIAAENNN